MLTSGAARDAAPDIFQSGGGDDVGVATNGGEGPGAGIAALSDSRAGRRFSETFGGGNAPIYAGSADVLASETATAGTVVERARAGEAATAAGVLRPMRALDCA